MYIDKMIGIIAIIGLFIYAVVSLIYLIRFLDNGVVNAWDTFAEWWDTGNIFGKVITVCAAIIFTVILAPALLIAGLIELLQEGWYTLYFLCFPGKMPCHKEVPLPDQETLQRLRDHHIPFVIGPGHITFENEKAWKDAKKYLKQEKA